MNADQITAIGTATAAIIVAIGVAIAKLTSRSSKDNRRTRTQRDVAMSYAGLLREQIVGFNKKPKPWPPLLRPSASDEEGDEDD